MSKLGKIDLFRPLSASLQHLAMRCSLEPIHLHRDTSVELSASGQEGIETLNLHCYPMMEALLETIEIPWAAHVIEENGWESVVIPKPLWEVFKREFAQAGFTEAPERRQFASADGLEEALRMGSDFNKSWR